MDVRRVTKEEWMQIDKIRSICFGYPIDLEKVAARIEKMSEDNLPREWGCFTDEGDLAAVILNNDFIARFDGHEVKMGGIGGVATLPEYRYGGAVKKIFEKLLREARDNGEVFSALFPFSHEFYRKVGYELYLSTSGYRFPVTLLSGYKHTGWTKRIEDKEGAPFRQMKEVYEAFAAKYNTMLCREDNRYTVGDPFKKKQFTMLLGDESGARAYLVYEREEEDGKVILKSRDLAWKDEDGFRMILGYLARMSADYAKISLTLPDDIPFRMMIPRPYEVKVETHQSPMARVTNVSKALELMKKPEGASFTIAVRDDFLSENSGVYRVDEGGARLTNEPADIEVSVQALALMVLGSVNLEQALYRTDVKLNGNAETLKKVFIRKPVHITNGF